MPNVSIMLDGYWFEMKGSSLVVDMSKDLDRTLCAVGIIPNMDNIWILGHAFYEDYYITHNAQLMQIIIAQDELGTKSAPEESTEEPNRQITDDYNWRMMLVKLFTCGAFCIGYWAAIEYGFYPSSFTGINFLNQTGHEVTYKRKAVADSLSKLDTETVQKLLAVLADKNSEG